MRTLSWAFRHAGDWLLLQTEQVIPPLLGLCTGLKYYFAFSGTPCGVTQRLDYILCLKVRVLTKQRIHRLPRGNLSEVRGDRDSNAPNAGSAAHDTFRESIRGVWTLSGRSETATPVSDIA